MILKCIKKHFFGISTQNLAKSRANWVKRIAESDSVKKGLSEKYVQSLSKFLVDQCYVQKISIPRIIS